MMETRRHPIRLVFGFCLQSSEYGLQLVWEKTDGSAGQKFIGPNQMDLVRFSDEESYIAFHEVPILGQPEKTKEALKEVVINRLVQG